MASVRCPCAGVQGEQLGSGVSGGEWGRERRTCGALSGRCALAYTRPCNTGLRSKFRTTKYMNPFVFAARNPSISSHSLFVRHENTTQAAMAPVLAWRGASCWRDRSRRSNSGTVGCMCAHAVCVGWQAEPIMSNLDCRPACVRALPLIPAPRHASMLGRVFPDHPLISSLPPFPSRALSTLRALVCIGHVQASGAAAYPPFCCAAPR